MFNSLAASYHFIDVTTVLVQEFVLFFVYLQQNRWMEEKGKTIEIYLSSHDSSHLEFSVLMEPFSLASFRVHI
jgi:hypothetical protein